MNFDLDIKNYDKCELRKLLKLGENYSNSDVERSCNMLQQRIADNSEIDLLLKSRVNNFLGAAKNLLIVVDVSSATNPTNSNLLPSNVVNENGHMIIQPPFDGTKINYELNANYMDGRFNPLFRKSVFKNITIDSRFRDNYFRTSASNFKVNLPMTLNKVIKMSVSEIELPLTFYAISRKFGNDNFWIHYIDKTNNNNNKWYFIRVPQGNYTHVDMISVLNEQLEYAKIDDYRFQINLTSQGSGDGRTILAGAIGTPGNSTNPPTNPINLYFNKQPLSNKSTISGGQPTEPPFDPTPLPLKIGWNLGFRQGDYKTKPKDAPIQSSTYISEGLYEAMGPRYIYLVVDDYNNNVNNTFFSAFNSSILNKNIIGRISIQGSVFSIMSDSSPSITAIPRTYFGPIDIQKMQIQLLDEYGRNLNIRFK